VTGEGRRESSLAELTLADEELQGAAALLRAGYPRIALTRAYFAVFHGARALLYAAGFEPRTHAGVQHLFNLHFVRSGRFDAATARLLARLQKYREEADYSRAFVVDAEGAMEELDAARVFVEAVRTQAAAGFAREAEAEGH
jgi:hypothetical protein